MNASKSRHEVVKTDLNEADEIRIPAMELFAQLDERTESIYPERWVRQLDDDPDMKWLTDNGATLHFVERMGKRIRDDDLVAVVGARFARVVGDHMWAPKEGTLKAVVAEYKGGTDALTLSQRYSLPPRVVMRVVLNDQKSGMVQRSLWQAPEKFLDHREVAEVNATKECDTASCEELRWATLEKVHLFEKLMKAWLKGKNVASVTRDVDPEATYPKPSLLTSPFEVQGRVYRWIEVCMLYGTGREFNKVVRERVAKLTDMHGGGLLVMPRGMDQGFTADWDPELRSAVHVVAGASLGAMLANAAVGILATDLLGARCHFDVLMREFLSAAKARSPRKPPRPPAAGGKSPEQGERTPRAPAAPNTDNQTSPTEAQKPAVRVNKPAAGARGSRGARGNRTSRGARAWGFE
eukprot:TRINITY_DN5099_c1_g1_i1.p2 TRINITY_DN5099_c1_g1~~TRINITY_DN5099_c1_g1_i1.p2  ORF type:complete len:409 (+),score=121.05 TRINITY_DN5099_c1_g1_i1:877-2103(+)